MSLLKALVSFSASQLPLLESEDTPRKKATSNAKPAVCISFLLQFRSHNSSRHVSSLTPSRKCVLLLLFSLSSCSYQESLVQINQSANIRSHDELCIIAAIIKLWWPQWYASKCLKLSQKKYIYVYYKFYWYKKCVSHNLQIMIKVYSTFYC